MKWWEEKDDFSKWREARNRLLLPIRKKERKRWERERKKEDLMRSQKSNKTRVSCRFFLLGSTCISLPFFLRLHAHNALACNRPFKPLFSCFSSDEFSTSLVFSSRGEPGPFSFFRSLNEFANETSVWASLSTCSRQRDTERDRDRELDVSTCWRDE